MTAFRSFIFFIALSTFSSSLYPNCEIPPQWQGLECQGSYKATNLAELDSFLSSPGIKTINGKEKAKNLIIDFDVNAPSLNLVTPCSILVKDGKSFTVPGEICINSKDFKSKLSTFNIGSLNITTKDMIRLNNGMSIIATGAIHMLSKNGTVVIYPNSNLTANEINLESQSNDVNPYVTIRENVTLTAPKIYLKAPMRTPIGHGSVLNATSEIKLITANDFHTSAWKSAIFNTPLLSAESSTKLTLLHRPAGSIGTLALDAPYCFLGHNADISGISHIGRCFLEQPHAVIETLESEGVTPFNVSFDMSKSVGELDRIEVDFGDGATGTYNAPIFNHNYTTSGSFVVKASYYHKNGQRSEAYLQVRALPSINPPEILLWANQVENGGVITTALSLFDYPAGVSPSDIKYFHYDLGAIGEFSLPMGARGTDEYGSFPVNFPQSGTYPITLTVELKDGALLSTGEQQVNVWENTFPVPLYSISSNSGALPLTVHFNAEDAYSSDGTTIAEYRWRFPNGEQRGENLKNISYTFTEPGYYNVRLRVISANGNRSQVNIPIFAGITPPITGLPPVAFIRADQRLGAAPHTVNFLGNESFDPENPTPGNLTYYWEFGSEGSSTAENPSYTFDNPGVYHVMLTITDVDGNQNVTGTYIYINAEDDNTPLDFFATYFGNGYVYFETYFLEQFQAWDPQSFIWRFDLGNEEIVQASGSYADIQLPSPGSYEISLSGRLVNGPYQTVQKKFTISESNNITPEGIITQPKDIFDLYEPVVLNAIVPNQSIEGFTFKWFTEGYYFEGQGSVGSQFIYQFASEGVKTIHLLIEDQNGFSTLLTQYPIVEIIQGQNNPPFIDLQIHGYNAV